MDELARVLSLRSRGEDRTFEEMRDEFRLRVVRAVYVPQAKSADVRGLYRSDLDSRLLVVDKSREEARRTPLTPD